MGLKELTQFQYAIFYLHIKSGLPTWYYYTLIHHLRTHSSIHPANTHNLSISGTRWVRLPPLYIQRIRLFIKLLSFD